MADISNLMIGIGGHNHTIRVIMRVFSLKNNNNVNQMAQVVKWALGNGINQTRLAVILFQSEHQFAGDVHW
jgi:hypothetical protein